MEWSPGGVFVSGLHFTECSVCNVAIPFVISFPGHERVFSSSLLAEYNTLCLACWLVGWLSRGRRAEHGGVAII